MFRTRIFCLLAVLCCLACFAVPAQAAEVDCDAVYCFSVEDFSGDEQLAGICIPSLP